MPSTIIFEELTAGLDSAIPAIGSIFATPLDKIPCARHAPAMAFESDSPLDSLWKEYGRAFQAWDDLTLGRWLAQTLGQIEGRAWRISHPLLGVSGWSPERWEVPAEVQFEVAPNAVTDTTDLGTARLRTGKASSGKNIRCSTGARQQSASRTD